MSAAEKQRVTVVRPAVLRWSSLQAAAASFRPVLQVWLFRQVRQEWLSAQAPPGSSSEPAAEERRAASRAADLLSHHRCCLHRSIHSGQAHLAEPAPESMLSNSVP